MTYQDEVERVAGEVAAQVLAALAMHEAGKLTADAFVAVVAAYITAANSATAALADLSLAAVLTVQTGSVLPPLGITSPVTDPVRLTKAAQTILDDLNRSSADEFEAALTSARMRVERLATAEAKTAAARAYSAAVEKSPHVTGWVRGMDSDPCQLCRWWYREGRVWPADHPMPTHPGCTCQPIPKTVDHIRPLYTPNPRRRNAS